MKRETVTSLLSTPHYDLGEVVYRINDKQLKMDKYNNGVAIQYIPKNDDPAATQHIHLSVHEAKAIRNWLCELYGNPGE